ncbi:hypothetical protein [Fulvimonas soli]|jgi:hypothetical protein|uniref:Uncharacterized protein n=1 Tax=Fulvimonas soli TaxID=155197 RepID=A0A316HLL7_9GAMM|nr:hypothetical protein [Fulvimonas soli]PWK82107.1 hypothetical protein C7456_11714 [Fulvimonas soli]TNY27022.1 hypothetical protein BV497_05665 [Fulvimonas soli]
MEVSLDFTPVYPRHDLLIEIGRIEMAMEHLAERDERERVSLKPRLESRMQRLRSELAHLAV